MSNKIGKKIAALGLALICALPAAFAQKTAETSERYIKTSGVGEVRLVPDKVTISFDVRTSDSSIDHCYDENTTNTNHVLALADKYHIDKKYVQTSNIFITPEHPNSSLLGSSNRISGYTVMRTIKMELHELESFSSLIREALKNGANGIDGYASDSSERIEARGKARLLALQAAHDKAEALAKGAGVVLGLPISIVEDSEFTSGNRRNAIGNLNLNSLSTEPSVVDSISGLSLGQLSIREQITATYAITP